MSSTSDTRRAAQSAVPDAQPPDDSQPNVAESVIRVEHLTIGYGQQVLMRDLNFEVQRGEVFVIIGGSGSGKSTLLKHMIGLNRPMRGHIWLDGKDIVDAQGEARLAILRRIGVTYQSGALFGSMTLAENVRLPLEEYTDLPDRAMELIALMKLDLVGLKDFAYSLPSEVSGGMQKRAAMARAMALDPDIMFLDEPSAGLDPVTSADLDLLILRLAQTLGMTFVVVSHELPSIFTIADRVIMLDRNTRTIAASGPPEELRDHSDNPVVRKFFNRQPSVSPDDMTRPTGIGA
jgi:phospholipid/cholesterol/gamma-HCH transport system ATP-binding protein